ncbi:hypothetical protein [Silvibacterium dinghuense]|uniref:Uncharacterized protein n=1 Tax=Silvibacterium dinghuense TaxID=1560006 RepID=A0A4Q1SGG6_9BACT|nr:hypothetical protein [Silvibacterium dinghuense]RXS96618.1 hypothetical protein ESZ00_01320 [Silvibacterium dinghuense]
MSLETLRAALREAHPPVGLTPLVEAMWWEAKGDWTRAHEIAQAIDSRDAAWVHAYLHRREGDEGNAGYWYRQAGRRAAHIPMDDEWREITEELLGR